MTKLKIFTVWIPTKFCLGCQSIKGKNFIDVFMRLGKKYKLKSGWIEDDNGDSKTFNEILSTEETI